MEERRVLVAESTRDICELRAEYLTAHGFQAEVADSIEQAMTVLRKAAIPVVVANLDLDGQKSGLILAEKILTGSPGTKVILIARTDRIGSALSALRLNIFQYIPKGRSDNSAMVAAVARAFEVLREENSKRYMLSFISHMMRNTFAGTKPALEEALNSSEALASKLDENREVYQMISKLAFIKTSLATVESMLNTFQLSMRKPENLHKAWIEDTQGDSDFGQLLSLTVESILNRLFFQEPLLPILERLSEGCGIEDRSALRRRFLSDFLLTDEERHQSAFAWLAENFPIVKTIGESPSALLNRGGLRFSLLFAVTSELFLNAIRYSDGKEPICIEWKNDELSYALHLRNTYSIESLRQRGPQQGLLFIDEVLKPFDRITVEYTRGGEDYGRFEARLSIDKRVV